MSAPAAHERTSPALERPAEDAAAPVGRAPAGAARTSGFALPLALLLAVHVATVAVALVAAFPH